MRARVLGAALIGSIADHLTNFSCVIQLSLFQSVDSGDGELRSYEDEKLSNLQTKNKKTLSTMVIPVNNLSLQVFASVGGTTICMIASWYSKFTVIRVVNTWGKASQCLSVVTAFR